MGGGGPKGHEEGFGRRASFPFRLPVFVFFGGAAQAPAFLSTMSFTGTATTQAQQNGITEKELKR